MKTAKLLLILAVTLTVLLIAAGCLTDPEETPASSNADLSSMTVSDGTLSPAFNKESTVYRITTDDTTLNVAADADDNNATVKVNDSLLAQGGTSQEITLTQGDDSISVVVTAPDGAASKTYVLIVSYPLSTNAYLAGLELVVDTTWESFTALSPTFDSVRTNFNLYAHVDTLRLRPTASDSTATIEINGTAVASGSTSSALVLPYDSTSIEVTVTAQDTSSTETYTIKVYRNAYLGGTWTLNQTFGAGFYSGTSRSDHFILTQTVDYGNSIISMIFGLRHAFSFDRGMENHVQGSKVDFYLGGSIDRDSSDRYLFTGEVAAGNEDSVSGKIVLGSDSSGTFTMTRSTRGTTVPTLGIGTTNSLTYDGSSSDWAAVDTPYIVDETGDVTSSGPAGADMVSLKLGKDTNDGSICYLLELASNADTAVNYEIRLQGYDPAGDSTTNAYAMIRIYYANGTWYNRSHSSVVGSAIALEYSNAENGTVLEGKYPSSMFHQTFNFSSSYLVQVVSTLFESNTELAWYDDMTRPGIFYFE